MSKSKNRNYNDASRSDERRKANKDERKQVKQILSEGRYEGLVTEKKLRGYSTEWDD